MRFDCRKRRFLLKIEIAKTLEGGDLIEKQVKVLVNNGTVIS
jgi:hypothetical protein